MQPVPVTIPALLEWKKIKRKITALTAYDYSFARFLDETDIDIVLFGDSLGMVALGYEDTLPVTMDEMIHHRRAVRHGIHHALVVADMPLMSCQASYKDAHLHACRFIQAGQD